MRVILGKGTHPHDAMQGAGRLIAMAGTEFGHAQRQIAVTFQPLAENLHMARTIHRFEGQGAVVL